jgi:putative spermidine/putrescine transport system permease protein
MRNVNLRRLEAFRAMMMTRSITRASELLCVSQPAVGRLINDLESSVEFPLFQRIKKRSNPAPEARFFYHEVARSFAGLNKINLAAREIRDFRSGSLSIAALPAPGLSYLPEFISRFSAGKPGISLSSNIRNSQKVSEMVAAQRVDVGFSEFIDFGDGVEAGLLLQVTLVCILPPEHPLAPNQRIDASDLDGVTCIGSGNSQLTYSDLDRYFEEKGVKRKTQIDVWYSIYLAIGSATLAVMLAIPAAIAAARYKFPGQGLVIAFFMSPLMVPHAVFGVAFLSYLSSPGRAGTYLGLVDCHIILIMPYALRLVLASVTGMDRAAEAAARSLGATNWATFRRITVPLILPGVTGGWVPAFIISFDDLTTTIFIASPSSTTPPVGMYQHITETIDPLIASVSAVIIFITMLIMVKLDQIFGLDKLLVGK